MSLAPDEKYCSSCGDTVKKAAEWCPSCGVKNSAETQPAQHSHVYCESCGEQINPKAEICPSCGVRQQPASPTLGENETEGKAETDELSTGLGKLWYYTQWGLGIIFLLAAVGALTDPQGGIVSTIFAAMITAGIGLVCIPQVREGIDKKHPITMFGKVQSVHETRIHSPTELCSKCYGDIEQGVQKEFGTDFTVAGYVLYREVDGANAYCQECLKIEEGAVDLDSMFDEEVGM